MESPGILMRLGGESAELFHAGQGIDGVGGRWSGDAP